MDDDADTLTLDQEVSGAGLYELTDAAAAYLASHSLADAPADARG